MRAPAKYLIDGRPGRISSDRDRTKNMRDGAISSDRTNAPSADAGRCAAVCPGRHRRLLLGLALTTLLSSLPAGGSGRLAGQELQLAELLSPQLWAKYQSQPKYKDRIEIYHQALDQLAGRLRNHLKKMEMDQVAESLRKISALSYLARREPARNSAGPKDLASKQVRKLEIHIRRSVVTFSDYRLSVPFDYRAEFESTMKDLEEWRNQLLLQLFGKAAAAPTEPRP